MRFFNFSFWTVAQREVREGARRWANYRLRISAGLAGMGLLWATIAGSRGGMGQTGALLFQRLHCLILILIVGIVPALAADCISREKREGTLGLLFLTPLTASGIVIGKSFAQMLRAWTLWLGIVPILTIPFLTGGVTWKFAFHMVTIEFCIAVMCMAGGILSSALAKTKNSAYFFAYAIATLALATLAIFEIEMWSPLGPMGGSRTMGDLFSDAVLIATGNGGFSRSVIYAPMYPGPPPRYWRSMARISAPAALIRSNNHFWFVLLSTAVLASGLALYLAIAFGAAAVERSWKDKVASARELRLMKRFCSPLFNRWFVRKMKRSLERNPIAWLQEYSWKARISKWGLCGLFILAETSALNGYANAGGYGGLPWIGPFRYQMQLDLALLLAAVFTFSGVNGFLTEKRSGALEILLVTPISINQIILGRAWGLWKQFLPAALILLFGQIGMANLVAVSSVHWALGRGQAFFLSESDFFLIFIMANAFLALPIFATYCALRVKNLIGGAALTWAGLFVAYIMGACMADNVEAAFAGGDLNMFASCAIILAFNFAFIALTFFLLRHSLSRRIYAF